MGGEHLLPKGTVASTDVDGLHVDAKLHARALAERGELAALEGRDAAAVVCARAVGGDTHGAEPVGQLVGGEVEGFEVGVGGGRGGDEGGRGERQCGDGDEGTHLGGW